MGIRSRFLLINLIVAFSVFVISAVAYFKLRRVEKRDGIMEQHTRWNDDLPVTHTVLRLLRVVMAASFVQTGLLAWMFYYLCKFREILFVL